MTTRASVRHRDEVEDLRRRIYALEDTIAALTKQLRDLHALNVQMQDKLDRIRAQDMGVDGE